MRHRIAAVDREVEDHELQLGRIDHHRPKILFQNRLDPYSAADRLQQQIAHAGDQIVEADHPGREMLPAAKREQLAR